MKIRRLLLPTVLLTFAACGGGGTDDYQDDGAVPPGAIPAAPDTRPDYQPGAAGASVSGDTTDSVGPAQPGADTTRMPQTTPR